jgi:FtsH-binding integral membrane protein
MAISIVKNIGQMGLEVAFSTAAISAVVNEGLVNVPKDLTREIVPVAGIFSGINSGLATVMGADQKPKIVQLAFPFFSGLLSTAVLYAMSAPVQNLKEAYLFCSTGLAAVALIKVIAKAIFKMGAEPKEESRPARVFNYVVAGAATFIPSIVAVRLFKDSLDDGFFALFGFFFGLAQVCVTTLLGAPQKESRSLHSLLPIFTSAIPCAILLGTTGQLTDKMLMEITVVTTTAVITAMIGTVVSRFFTSQTQVKEKDEGAVVGTDGIQSSNPIDSRSRYRRPGFTSTLPHHLSSKK